MDTTNEQELLLIKNIITGGIYNEEQLAELLRHKGIWSFKHIPTKAIIEGTQNYVVTIFDDTVFVTCFDSRVGEPRFSSYALLEHNATWSAMNLVAYDNFDDFVTAIAQASKRDFESE